MAKMRPSKGWGHSSLEALVWEAKVRGRGPSTFSVPTADEGNWTFPPLDSLPLVIRAFKSHEDTAHDACHRKVSFNGVSRDLGEFLWIHQVQTGPHTGWWLPLQGSWARLGGPDPQWVRALPPWHGSGRRKSAPSGLWNWVPALRLPVASL